MTDSDKSDFVEDALATLRESSVTESPSDQLLSLTVERIRLLSSQQAELTEGVFNSRRDLMLRVKWFGVVAALCASILMAAAWIGRIDPSVSIAFADVQKQVQKFRSIQYKESPIVFDDDGNPQNPRATKDEDSGKGGKVKVIPLARHLVMGHELERVESVDADGQISNIHISDFKNHKLVSLDVKEKRITITDISNNTIKFGEGTVVFSKIEPASAELYKELNEISSSTSMTKLPARKIDDKQVVGFVFEKKFEQKVDKETFTETLKRIYWIDTATKLPVRVDCSVTNNNAAAAAQKLVEWMKYDFVFDAELDPKLFSTETPEGYTVEKGGGFILVPAGGDKGKGVSIEVR
ncbi:MAG: hypothetical protein WCH39_24555 [Schlesneria sp.]